MSDEKRKQTRMTCYAKAVLLDTMAPGYIRDLSRSGCQVTFMLPVQVAQGDLLKFKVIAEHDPSISPFELCLRVRWVKRDPVWFSLGGEIESVSCAEGEDFFDRLVDYYEKNS